MKRALYESFYKLTRDPFRLTPDGHFTYSHPTYQKALAFLKYAVYREEVFVMITGRPGTGKTTLINNIVSQFDPDEVLIATLVTTQLEAADLLHIVAAYFGIHVTSESKSALLLQIEQFLRSRVEEGKRVILIVDEAQGLRRDAIEELRLLSNLVAHNKPMLQIFLVGQQELRSLVKTHDLEQLRQRITAAAYLNPLNEEEVFGYVRHRLSASGWGGDPQIENAAVRLIYHYSEGIPRKINLICSRFLLHGSILELHELRARDLENVLGELKDEFLIFDEGLVPVEELLDLENEPAGFLEVPERSRAAAGSADVQVEKHAMPASSAAAGMAAGTGSAAAGESSQAGAREHAIAADPGPSIRKPEAVDSRSVRAGEYPHANGQAQQDPAVMAEHRPFSVRQAAASSSGYATGPEAENAAADARNAGMRVLLTGLSVIFVALVVLFLLRLGSGYLAGRIANEAAVISGKVSERVAEMTGYYDSSLARIASDAAVISLLEKGDRKALQAKQTELRTRFPSAINLRLLPAGSDAGEQVAGAVPDGAELAQILAMEPGRPVPIEIHQPDSANRHVNIVRRVLTADRNTMVGTIVLSLWDEMLQDILAGLEKTGSYIELQQYGEDGAAEILATHGDAFARIGRPGQVLPVRGSRWQIAWWPPRGLLWVLTDISLAVQAVIALALSIVLVLLYTLLFRRDTKSGE